MMNINTAALYLCLQLLEELEGMLRDQPEPTDALRYQETLLSIQTLIQSKHDHSTEEILKVGLLMMFKTCTKHVCQFV
jgi:hypothetical protein